MPRSAGSIDSTTGTLDRQYDELRTGTAADVDKLDELDRVAGAALTRQERRVLDFVAQGRITIVGPPVDSRMDSFHQFESQERIAIQPTRILPAIGYRSTLTAIAGRVTEAAPTSKVRRLSGRVRLA